MSLYNTILVGNAGSLLHKQNGKKIDSFDFVVRMGSCKVRGYEEYVGHKTDLYRISWDRLLHNIRRTDIFRPIDIFFKFNSFLFLEQNSDIFTETSCLSNHSRCSKLFKKPFFTEISFNSKLFLRKNERITHEQCLSFFVNKYNVTRVEYMDIQQRIKAFTELNTPLHSDKLVIPSSGILTLFHIMHTRPNDNIYITGYDSFQTRYYWRDIETYFDGHSAYREKMLIKKLIKSGRILLLE